MLISVIPLPEKFQKECSLNRTFDNFLNNTGLSEDSSASR